MLCQQAVPKTIQPFFTSAKNVLWCLTSSVRKSSKQIMLPPNSFLGSESSGLVCLVIYSCSYDFLHVENKPNTFLYPSWLHCSSALNFSPEIFSLFVRIVLECEPSFPDHIDLTLNVPLVFVPGFSWLCGWNHAKEVHLFCCWSWRPPCSLSVATGLGVSWYRYGP
jgi:hypothetical protein